MNRKPIITSIKTYYLTKNEKKLFKKEKPWGIILFKRNLKSKKQMKELTGKLPSTVFAVTGGGSNLSAISYPYYNEKNHPHSPYLTT